MRIAKVAAQSRLPYKTTAEVSSKGSKLVYALVYSVVLISADIASDTFSPVVAFLNTCDTR